MELPLREVTINKEKRGSGLKAVSVVEDPAIESTFVKLSKVDNAFIFASTKEHKFSENAEQQILTGPVLIPDKKILRFDKETKEYYNIFFSAQTIKDCAVKFFQDKHTTDTTISHEYEVDGTVYFESWIKEDMEKDKSLALGLDKDLPVGTWFMSLKIQDAELWKEVKDKKYTGFSIEAYFDEKLVENNMKKNIYNKKELIDMGKTMLENIQSFLDKLTSSDTEEKLEDVKIESGDLIRISEDKTVLKINEDGTTSTLEDGDYIIPIDETKQRVITVEGGKVTKDTEVDIVAVQESVETKVEDKPVETETKTEEKLEVTATLEDGTLITIDDTGVPRKEDCSLLEDGEYTLADKLTKILVKEGIVQPVEQPDPTAEMKAELEKLKLEVIDLKSEIEKRKTDLENSNKRVEELEKEPAAKRLPLMNNMTKEEFDKLPTWEKVNMALDRIIK